MNQALATRPGELDTYYEQISRVPLLSQEEERELAIRYFEHRDLDAAQRLVSANLRFVVKLAHEFKRYGCALADLVQEGNVGLMLAVRKYNPYKGYRLISYAVWWIKAKMRQLVMRTWSMVSMGTTRAARKLFPRKREVHEAVEADRAGDGDGSRVAGLAEELGITDAEVLEMELRLAARDFSLDARVGDEEGSVTHLDLLEGGEPSPEAQVAAAELRARARDEVGAALARLPERERQVVQRRVLSEDPPSLAELGREMGVSRERVRQIEASGMRKVRAYLTSGKRARVRELVA